LPSVADAQDRCVCGAPFVEGALACPACGALRYKDELLRLAQEAEAATGKDAVALWQQALRLLPRASLQAHQIETKLAALETEADAVVTREPSRPSGTVGKAAGAAGAVGLVLWKVKWLVLVILGKGKLLLLGLTKATTVFSMLLSFGVYWSLFGWKFAAGFLLSIYVHEMGHVWSLRRHGLPASAPMFIPGLGAFVRLKARPATAAIDAEIGLAGPIWGAAAALACLGAYHAFDSELFHALARTGAFINLFNLVPVWQLDGSRAFHPMSRWQRAVCAGVALAAFFVTSESMLLVVAAVAGFRAVSGEQGEGDNKATTTYVILVAFLALLLKA